jgi:hypothetical protein
MSIRLTGIALMLLAGLSLAAGQDQPTGASPPSPEPATSQDLAARYEQMAVELKQGVPEREITIKAVPAVKTKLFRADPKLLENKFVATFELKRSIPLPRSSRGGGFGSSPDWVRPLSESMNWFSQPLRAQLKSLIEKSPEDARPPKRMIDFLTSDDCDRDVRHSGMGRVMQLDLSFQVFAPTAEIAEERARAIIQLYDAGFSQPHQRAALQEGQQALEQARKHSEELPKLTAAISAEQAKLAKPTEISAEILAELKAQKVMQTVEMAGLNARVKACDAMLADPKRLSGSALESISDMKVKAEIERVGIKEKLDQINAFIAEGDQRNATGQREADLFRQRSGVVDQIEANQRVATSQAELFTHFRPLDLDKNLINIGPVEWVSE